MSNNDIRYQPARPAHDQHGLIHTTIKQEEEKEESDTEDEEECSAKERHVVMRTTRWPAGGGRGEESARADDEVDEAAFCRGKKRPRPNDKAACRDEERVMP